MSGATGNKSKSSWLADGYVVFAAIVIGGIILVLSQSNRSLNTAFGVLLAYIIGLFAAIVLARMLSGQIDLKFLISEENGQASMSRFQFLIFTFVIASSYFLAVAWLYTGDDTTRTTLVNAIAAGKPILPDLPQNVLYLIGISGGSYIVSKGIQKAGGTSAAPAGGAGAGGAAAGGAAAGAAGAGAGAAGAGGAGAGGAGGC